MNTASPRQSARPLPFRSVNRRDHPGYRPDFNRHHMLPREALRMPSLAGLMGCIGARRLGIDDFRANGLLLPANERAAVLSGLPLHRGPHPQYNAMVLDRMGAVERALARERCVLDLDDAATRALERLAALRRDLRLKLLDQRKPLRLNRRDPIGLGTDFRQLDAMAEALWRAPG